MVERMDTRDSPLGLWGREAHRNEVLPLDNRMPPEFERIMAEQWATALLGGLT